MADAAVVVRAADVAAPTVRTGQWFYVGFGIFVILLSFAGFAPSLIDQSRRFAPPTTLLMVHGATAFAWLLLYVTQALLVKTGKGRPSSPLWLGMPVAHMMGALVGRVPLSRDTLAIGWVVIAVAIYFIPAVHDKLTRGRIHRASIWIPVLLIVWFVVLNAVVAPSALALKVGSWLLK
jgi:hypothetical protein